MTGPVRFPAPPDGVPAAAMLAAYARDGFLVLDGYLSASACRQLKERAERLAATCDPSIRRTVFSTADQRHARDRYFGESAEAIGFFFEPQAADTPAAMALNKIGHALHDLDPVFAAVSRSARLGALARGLGLVDPRPLQSMYMFKSPRIGGAVDWHQDATFLHTQPSSVTGFWIALDPADGDNGCLLVLPGGHRGPLRQRFVRAGDGFEMQTLDASPWPDTLPLDLPVDRGALVVLHGLLPHASAANRSSRPRHAYALHVVDGTTSYGAENWLQRPRLGLRALP